MAELDLASLIVDADELPKLSRGRSSEDYDTLIEIMKDSKPHKLPNIAEEDRAKIGQKIRGAAAKAKFKVTVRYSKPEQALYFKREPEKEPKKVEPTTEATKATGTTKKS